MKDNCQRGAITVFLSIVLMIFIILAGVIVDGVRLRISEVQVKRSSRLSLQSVLAGYNSNLKEDYGLFALDYDNEIQLKDAFMYYMQKNLSITEDIPSIEFYLDNDEDISYWDIYDYTIEKISLTPVYSLNDDEIIRNQILEHMKLRGPQKIVDEFLHKLFEFNKYQKSVTAFKKKLDIEEELYQLAVLQDNLETVVSQANKFNSGHLKDSSNILISNIKDIYKYQKQQESLLQELDSLRRNQTEEDTENINRLMLKLYEIDTSIGILVNEIIGLQKEIGNTVTNFLAVNREALALVDLIEIKSKKIIILIDELEGEIDDEESDINNELKKDVEKFKRIINKKEVEEVVDLAKENIAHLEEAKAAIEEADIQTNSLSIDTIKIIEDKINEFQGHVAQYKTMNYSKPKVDELDEDGIEIVDDRKTIAVETKKFLKDKQNIITKKIDDSVFQSLPSKGKNITLEDDDVEFDTDKGKNGFAFVSFDFLSTLMFNSSKNGFIDIRDEAYINEYIIGTFKSYVSDKDNFTRDLRNINKASRKAFFDYEVEYILYGSQSQAENILKAKRDILAIRFVFNVLNVYQSPELVKKATVIASSIAPLLGGASMPLIKTLILCGWAMVYSIEDVIDLMQGKEVNLFRKNKTIKFNYEDYLRILLLRPGMKKMKLDRTKDLIQINLSEIHEENFTIENLFTFVSVDIVYSIKYLFINNPLLMENNESVKNRYFNKIQLWHGY
ncbi:DUF5702 domain-containing protein [Alkaliphilus peptidifermentans]|uniref:Uncharacterized protein n=1 Tax=Alkaliphilus peptidifermentans DSM 18978 TaxID=1120976 RepID=A0A1G5J7U9_9FIRM|nr:DUF5702 domain-containing protein [Alkaliphilus peptidifermentans]SCY84436.1 hypothetical protein SAMN03080606_02702 [Alkaliphilus peptidifermentans DSM 18978]